MAKKDYDKTLTRLIGILTKLSLCELLDSKEFSEIYSVTQRTIQKDIYTRLNSFPIEKNTQGKFKFIDGFSLDKSMLNIDEMILISLSLSQFDNMKYFHDTSDKIFGKLLYPKLSNPYFIKQNQLAPINTNPKLHSQLKRAIKNKYIIEIVFGENIFTVEPYKLTNFDGFWYLFAKDIKTNKMQNYILSEIKKVSITTKQYKITDEKINNILKNVHSAWFEDGEAYTVIIKVNKNIAHYFKQRNFLHSQKILQEFENGDLQISFDVTHDEDIDNIIKSWLPDIEVLEPKRYKKKIISELKEYLSQIDK